jgi:hypothetical protein
MFMLTNLILSAPLLATPLFGVTGCGRGLTLPMQYIFYMKFIVAQRFKSLNMYVVHFGLIQNEPKDQGCESIGGGCCRATEKFQGRICLNSCVLNTRRLMKFFNSSPASHPVPAN